MNKADRYLITGGAGYLGRALISRLVGMGYENLVVMARNEGKLLELQNRHPNIEILPADVANAHACARACSGVRGVFHLAAFKHVLLAEANAVQCVTSNITGTLNLLRESYDRKPEFFVFISTDKAGKPNSVYGATKFLGERMVKEYAKVNPATRYRVLRYGNVWGSTGSVVPKWRSIIESGGEITLTEPTATRFYFRVSDAVDLILSAIQEDRTADPIIPDMKAVKVGTLLEVCREAYGKCRVKVIGLQPGENLHETLDGVRYSNEYPLMTKDEVIETFIPEAVAHAV